MSNSTKNEDFLVPAPKKMDIVAINKDNKSNEIKSKRKEIILEEEKHIKNLEKIITRDFFPLLHAIDEQEKSEVGDLSTNMSAKQGMFVDEDIEDLTLNQYVAKYNSEDNASFEKLLDVDKQRWNEKHWWITKQEEEARLKQLAIQASTESKLNNMIEGSRENHLQITNYEAKNNFMFAASAKGTSTFTYSDPDSNEQKKIDYSNTRLSEDHLSASDLKHHLAERDSIQEKMKYRMQTPDLLGMSINKTPQHGKKNEFQMLAMPSPSPGVNESPVMTWGRIDATPVILNRPSSFQIQNPSLRDELSNQLSLNILKKKKMSQMNQKEKMKELLTPNVRKSSEIRRDTTPSLSSKSKSIKKESISISTPKDLGFDSTKSTKTLIQTNKLIPQKDLTKNLLDI